MIDNDDDFSEFRDVTFQYVAAEDVGYLPMHCPSCDRVRLLYSTNATRNVVFVRCEKCHWDSDRDRELGPAHSGDEDRRPWPTAVPTKEVFRPALQFCSFCGRRLPGTQSSCHAED
jgi:hypothetical protein